MNRGLILRNGKRLCPSRNVLPLSHMVAFRGDKKSGASSLSLSYV